MKFEKAAHALGIQAEVIGHSDLGRLDRFDGLFIRDNTFINPKVDAGNEDGVLKEELYLEVMRVFASRMVARRQRLP